MGIVNTCKRAEKDNAWIWTTKLCSYNTQEINWEPSAASYKHFFLFKVLWSPIYYVKSKGCWCFCYIVGVAKMRQTVQNKWLKSRIDENIKTNKTKE